MPAPSKREKSMSPIAWRCVLSALLAVVGLASARSARAADPAAEARQAWQLLDYIAVDYPAAIQMGATHVRVGTAIFGARPRRD